MKLNRSDLVTDFHLSKKIKELGTSHESVFSWAYSAHLADLGAFLINTGETPADGTLNWRVIPALTSQELGVLLPSSVYSRKSPEGANKTWACVYVVDQYLGSDFGDSVEVLNHMEFGDTEAEARGKMLVYLVEKGILTIK